MEGAPHSDIRRAAQAAAAARSKKPARRRKKRPAALWSLLLWTALIMAAGLSAGAMAALWRAAPSAQQTARPAGLDGPLQAQRPDALRLWPAASPDAPWLRNALPFGPDPRPRLAVILLDDGRDPALSAEAMRLAAPVSLALAAHLEALPDRLKAVRANGHEALMGLPFDPDPPGAPSTGPLEAGLPEAENLRRLKWRLQGAGEAAGIVSLRGEAATRDGPLMELAMRELAASGHYFVDGRATPQSLAGAAARRMGAPAGDVSLRIDDSPGKEAARARLDEAERRAALWGAVIAAGALTPETLAAVQDWAKARGDNESTRVALAPVSAVIKRLRSASRPPS